MKDGGASGKNVRDVRKMFGGVCHCRLVRRCKVPNGCRRPVLRLERSRGCELGAVGNDAVSSAQSRCTVDSEMALLRSSWGELGYTGGDGDAGGKQGTSQCIDDGGGGIGDVETQGDVGVVVCDTVDAVGGSEYRTWVTGASWGCTDGPGSVCRRLSGARLCSESGRSGGAGVIEYDGVGSPGGSTISTGACGTSLGTGGGPENV